jgi:hypothetical protein
MDEAPYRRKWDDVVMAVGCGSLFVGKDKVVTMGYKKAPCTMTVQRAF